MANTRHDQYVTLSLLLLTFFFPSLPSPLVCDINTCLSTVARSNISALSAVTHDRILVVEAVKTGRILVHNGVVFVDENQADFLQVGGGGGGFGVGHGVLYMYSELVCWRDLDETKRERESCDVSN